MKILKNFLMEKITGKTHRKAGSTAQAAAIIKQAILNRAVIGPVVQAGPAPGRRVLPLQVVAANGDGFGTVISITAFFSPAVIMKDGRAAK